MLPSKIIDIIQNCKMSGDFGWDDEGENVKGITFESGTFQILACAGGSYITIAYKSKNEDTWAYVCSHDSCWRDGLRKIITEYNLTEFTQGENTWVDIGDDVIFAVSPRN